MRRLCTTFPGASAIALVGLVLAAGTPGIADASSLDIQPVLGTPASDVAVIGASPGESPGEAWARGQVGVVPATVGPQSIAGSEVLLRFTNSSDTWQVVPVEDAQGDPLSFRWWAAEVTNRGGVVLAGDEDTAAGFAGVQSIVTRNPGGAFAQARAPRATPAEAGAEAPEAQVIEPEERLFPIGSSSGRASTAPLVASLDEADGHTGALVVPVWTVEASSKGEGSTGTGSTEGGSKEGGATEAEGKSKHPLGPGILHYDGSAWSREPICAQYSAGVCTPTTSGALKPLAIAAGSPQSAWLLASSSSHQPELFQRVTPTGNSKSGESPIWVPVQFSSGLLSPGGVPSGESLSTPSEGPILTATTQGAWVDLALGGGSQIGSATLFASASLQSAGAETSDTGTVLGTWCYPTSLCAAGTPSLGAALPSDYASSAWSGTGSDPGARIISGLSHGALLILPDGQNAFAYTIGEGDGGAGSSIGPGGVTLGQIPGTASTPSGGAAFDTLEEGWLGGTRPLLHLTSSPDASRLQSWPVPFRNPLLAVAAQPGSTPGDAGAQALAVGANGEVARYLPGQGWTGEYLYNSSGERQTPNLRGVAWPEPDRAYAVGDNGAMWVWQADSGLWETDPAKPIGFVGQLNAIAFSPTNPDVGYAVGKQGTLLSYDKTWTQDELPPGLGQANFTSVAFAGSEAIATYRMLTPTAAEVGGLIVNNGSGWQLDPSAQALLSSLSPVLSKVAGLPDGGAVAAGPGVVIERDSASADWRFSSAPLPEAENVAAVAAFREGPSVRALVSLDTYDNPNGSLLYQDIDAPPGPTLGQYGQLLGPDPLPQAGFLMRETAGGWEDEQDADYPEGNGTDLPGWPDAVLALLVDPAGEEGWVVGGQTGGELALATGQSAVQTAGVMRYGPGPAPPQSTSAPISTPVGQASFAVAGDAQCGEPCADFAREQLGPDAWLSGAIGRAGEISGLRAFLYTGARISPGASSLSPDAFARELADYAGLLSGGTLPVYAASSPSDIPSGATVSEFSNTMGRLAPAGTVPAGTPTPPAGSAAYAFDSTGSGGSVRMIVLDYSGSTLAPGDTSQPSCPSNLSQPINQLQWLCSQLYFARQDGIPAVVVGNAGLSNPNASNYAQDAAAVSQVLLAGGASAYLFESPGENVAQSIGTGTSSIPAYGTGTLGYVSPPLVPQDFLGASGFLVVSVDVAQRNAQSNRAPVTSSLIPSIGQLGLEAADGTLVRRSQVALFKGLARRPEGGEELLKNSVGGIEGEAPEPYVPIPESCNGSNCSQFIPPSYSFTSSNPEVGDFVEQDPNSTNPRAVLHAANGKPVQDSASGLFCAYNAGTTTVTLSTGGLSYSETVTVQPGSVEQPCGTTPLSNPPRPEESQSLPIVAAPTPLSPSPALRPTLSINPPPPPPAAPAPAPPAARPYHPPLAPLLPAAAVPLPVHVALPAPVPQSARPSPPSGTSEVTQPVGATEKERERQGAVDVVHNMAAYRPGGETLPSWWPVALILIAAGAGTGLRRAPREPSPAWAQVRMTSRSPRRHRRHR